MNLQKFLELASVIEEVDERAIENLRKNHQYYHNVDESFTYISCTNKSDLYLLFVYLGIRFRNYRGKKPRFLDVGAGTGSKVKLAQEFGFDAVGVEFHEPYVKLGRKVHKLSSKNLIVKDAFDLDAEFLKDFDLVYTYMPIENKKRMSELNLHIHNNLRHGAIRAEMLPIYYPMNLMPQPQFFDRRVEFAIYIKS